MDKLLRSIDGRIAEGGHAVKSGIQKTGLALAVLATLGISVGPVSAATCKTCTPPPKKVPVTASSPAWVTPPAWMNLPANAQFLGVIVGDDGVSRSCWKYVRRTLCDPR